MYAGLRMLSTRLWVHPKCPRLCVDLHISLGGGPSKPIGVPRGSWSELCPHSSYVEALSRAEQDWFGDRAFEHTHTHTHAF